MASEWTPSLVTFPLTVSPFVWNRITLTRATITITTAATAAAVSFFSLDFPLCLFQLFSLFLISRPYSLAREKPFSRRTLLFPRSHFSSISFCRRKTCSTICLWRLSKIICETFVAKERSVGLSNVYIR